MNSAFFKISLSLLLSLAASCAKKSSEDATGEESLDDKISYVVESSLSEAAGHLSASASATASVLNENLGAHAECSYATARASCLLGGDTSSLTLDWNGCTVGTASLTGLITEIYSGGGADNCRLSDGTSKLTRLISSNQPRVLTFASGATLTSTQEVGTGWDGETFPDAATKGTEISRVQTGTLNGLTCTTGNPCLRVVVHGQRNVMKGPLGRTWFDHLVVTDLASQGRRSTGNLVVRGNVVVRHQVARYTATSTFDSVTWGSSSCCYPTSGTINTVFDGSVAGSATTTFSSSCGSASFSDPDGETTTLTLRQCQP